MTFFACEEHFQEPTILERNEVKRAF